MIKETKFVLYQPDLNNFNSVLFAPITNYSRLSYTCFTVNRDLLVFGSSSGSLYVFQFIADKPTYLFNIPNNEGRITCLSFASYTDTMLAIGTAKGGLIIINFIISDENRYSNWKTIYCVKNFCTSSINLIKWDYSVDSRIFVCEELGSVFLISKINSLTTLLVPQSPILVLKVDCLIHQIDLLDHLLVISTLNRTFIYNILNNSVSNFGTKSRPTGTFGAMFFVDQNEANASKKCIYVSRPGARIWKTDLDGNVLLTHQFKNNIAETPISNILTDTDQNLFTDKYISASTFAKFHLISNSGTSFLLAQSSEPSSAMFIIDLLRPRRIICVNLKFLIQDMLCLNNEIFILRKVVSEENGSKQNMIKLKLMKLEDYLAHLLNIKQTEAGFKLIISQLDYFQDILKVNEEFKQLLKNSWISLDDTTQDNYKEIKMLTDDDDNQRKPESSLPLTSSKPPNKDEIVKKERVAFEEVRADDVKNEVDMNTSKEAEEVKVEDEQNMIEEVNQSTHNLEIIKKINKLKDNLIENGMMNKLKCECGFPKPGSHLYLDANQVEVRNILESIDKISFNEQLEICYQCALWTYYCHLLIKGERYEDYLKICIALSDASLLNDGMFQDYVKTNHDVWMLIFEAFNKLSIQKGSFVGSCINCARHVEKVTLSWGNLLRYVLKNMNGRQALNLLTKYEHFIPCDSLSPSICLSIIKSHAISLYQSSVTCNKLSQLSAILKTRE